ncbi:branched-chain amino acid ABC transporter permease [Azoarcus sp. TTM-91]|uniref:Amino acid/amide ABC transporter membrane protein 1 (HAAT family) n=1 Tax=Azoarcus indigens TaxID=29545 RepID=A0A4R6DM53_9RHOO|nr:MULTISPECIES: branched-chain amino acid ABC transporter permease [Azoarcus]NMG33700.1 branched-chain amino acid ABC transporter permease [Azoarcus sp. TTM-91]NMG66155.1 branched-chain amino acid ABC transporter permease [Azoarcus indigens]TDN45574.1 amino acid/amide ABC transporter membrane protein 1 (HAAT family) [Azoarcus indigens]
MLIVDVLLAGFTLGGMYALIAMGLTLQYGVARIMNLSYGEVLVMSAFGTWFAVTRLDWNPVAVLLASLPLGYLASWLIYRVLMMPLVRRSGAGPALEVDSILATFGLLFLLQGVLLLAFGGNYYSYSYLSQPVDILGSQVAANRLVVLGFAAAIGLGLYLLLTRSRLGTAVRAVAVAPRFAPLVGIDVWRLSAIAFGIGGALVAGGGTLLSMFLPFSATMGVVFAMKALVVVIMGGVGNLLGCLVAGLMLGFAETLVARFVDPGLTLAVNFALFLLVLLLRPAGLFGRVAR